MATVNLSCYKEFNSTNRTVTATVTSDYNSGTYYCSFTSSYTSSSGPYTRVGLYINGELVYDSGYDGSFSKFPSKKNSTHSITVEGKATRGVIPIKLAIGVGHNNLTDATNEQNLIKVAGPTISTPSISSRTGNSIVASFSISDNGGSDITDSKMQISSYSDFRSIITTKNGTSNTFDGLSPGQNYYIRSYASNAYASTTSEGTPATTLSLPVISNIIYTPKIGGMKAQADIDWKDSNLLNYLLYYKKSGATNYTSISGTLDATNHKLNFETSSTLGQDEVYSWHIEATNSAGTATTTDTIKATKMNDPDVSISSIELTPFTAQVTVNASVPSLTRNFKYQFTAYDDNEHWSEEQDSNIYTFTDLDEETVYTYRTRAIALPATEYGTRTSKVYAFTFTTPADQARVRIKTNDGWVKGKMYYRINDEWVKAKKVYIKENNTWVIGKND